uniref:DNA polymerase alpha subunit B n=1 Tax=Oryzias sinensis TaxID=183150 RepID=A0A8C8DXK6_9TELE
MFSELYKPFVFSPLISFKLFSLEFSLCFSICCFIQRLYADSHFLCLFVWLFVCCSVVEQCICHRIQEDDMVCEWMAYNSRNPKPLTMNTLEQFEHEVKAGHCSIKAEEEEENLLDSYSTPAKGSQKRPLTTPEHPQSKRSAALLASPGLLLSPASFSANATPSQKYNQRGAKGEVVVTFGATQGTRWAGRKNPAAGVQVDFLEGPEDSLHCSYKFMFQRLRDVRNVLAEKIEDLGETVRSHFHIEEFASVSLPAQDSITVSGQICCDSNGKLNAQSVLLEAGPEHGGQQVAVDLSELKEYSLFPGQVVVMEGMNTTGEKLVASKIYEVCLQAFLLLTAEPLNVLVACGPYTPSDSLTFDPLLDLISVITRDRPDVCLMLGPFVDSRHEQIEKGQVTETFEAIFSRCIESIVDGTRSVGCHLVFVPSQRDVHHPLIYPQPPFTLRVFILQRITLVPDPCTLLIDGVTFGLTSTDILFHMGAEEISKGSGSDRFSRILKHMLVQRSYYPLYPPAEEVNMDYEKFQSFAQIPLIPDVLIVPSELRYFIKVHFRLFFWNISLFFGAPSSVCPPSLGTGPGGKHLKKNGSEYPPQPHQL